MISLIFHHPTLYKIYSLSPSSGEISRKKGKKRIYLLSEKMFLRGCLTMRHVTDQSALAKQKGATFNHKATLRQNSQASQIRVHVRDFRK